MGLYKGPVCKLCRREGSKLFLKGDRCDSPKCALSKRSYPPGANGASFRGKLSEYGIRLREKQKARRYYYINEKQFRGYYKKANDIHGNTGEVFLKFLESRLDTFVYRSGIVSTKKQSRQMIKHGHLLVNGKKVDIPSYILKEKDVVSVSERSKKSFEAIFEANKNKSTVSWINSDFEGNKFEFIKVPDREELIVPINEQFVIEFYSR